MNAPFALSGAVSPQCFDEVAERFVVQQVREHRLLPPKSRIFVSGRFGDPAHGFFVRMQLPAASVSVQDFDMRAGIALPQLPVRAAPPSVKK